MTPKYIQRMKRRLDRYTKMKEQIEAGYGPDGCGFTYHGGFGYLKGQITEIADIIDDLEEEV